jgi:hypothetical protein
VLQAAAPGSRGARGKHRAARQRLHGARGEHHRLQRRAFGWRRRSHRCSPEQAFWWGAISAHAGSASGEKSLALRGNRASAQECLLSPAKRPAAAPHRAASVPAPHRMERALPGLARRVRALGEGRPRPGLRRRAHERRAIEASAAEASSGTTRSAEQLVALASSWGACDHSAATSEPRRSQRRRTPSAAARSEARTDAWRESAGRRRGA